MVWTLRGIAGLARRCRAALGITVHVPANDSFTTICLLAVLTVLNAFDLAFTESQLPRGNFIEANAVALLAAEFHPLGMLAYKVILFAAGASTLYWFRRRWESQAGLWLLTGVYSVVMIWWIAYLDAVEICLSDPAVVLCGAP